MNRPDKSQIINEAIENMQPGQRLHYLQQDIESLQKKEAKIIHELYKQHFSVKCPT